MTLSPQTELFFFAFSNVSEAVLETLIMTVFFHFLYIFTNFELKNKMHWCKDAKPISD